jgi:trimethylamine--corrinoid protein Co-methyltransferase
MPRNLHAGRNLSSGLSLNILTDDELEEIHLGTLELLMQTGIWMEDNRALELMTGLGADVDLETKIVKIPPHVVEDAIRSAPHTGSFYQLQRGCNDQRPLHR